MQLSAIYVYCVISARVLRLFVLNLCQYASHAQVITQICFEWNKCLSKNNECDMAAQGTSYILHDPSEGNLLDEVYLNALRVYKCHHACAVVKYLHSVTLGVICRNKSRETKV